MKTRGYISHSLIVIYWFVFSYSEMENPNLIFLEYKQYVIGMKYSSHDPITFSAIAHLNLTHVQPCPNSSQGHASFLHAIAIQGRIWLDLQRCIAMRNAGEWHSEWCKITKLWLPQE